MSWSFEQYRVSDLASFNNVLVFDGRNIWAPSHFYSDNKQYNYIHVYSYFDRANDYEGLSQNYYFDNNQVDLVKVIRIGGNPGTPEELVGDLNTMTYWNGFVYFVLDGLNNPKLYKVNCNTFEVTELFDFGNNKPDKICAANNKIWCCIDLHSLDQDRNIIVVFDILTNTASTIAIPGKKQETPRKIIDGLKGWVYVTARNEHSIIRINTTTLNVDGIHFVNRHPYSLGVTQNQEIWVVSDVTTSVPAASDEELTVVAESTGTNEYTTSSIKPKETTPVQLTGMLQKMNQTTFDITNFGAAGGQLQSVLIDEEQDHIWHIGGLVTIARTKISNKKYRYANAKSDGFNIEIPFYPNIGLITPKLTYDRWNGTDIDQITVRPYLFFLNGSNRVVGIRLNSMVRKNYYQVRGTGMIATGEQKYFGE